MEVLKQSLTSLQIDSRWIIQRVVDITMEAIRAGETDTTDNMDRLEFEIGQLMKKKENVLEAFFTKSITKEEMRMMNERYDKELAELNNRMDVVKSRRRIVYEISTLQDDIRKHITSILSSDQDSEVFLKNVLDHMVVFHDKRIEVYLNLLPHKWIFVLEQLKNLKSQNPFQKKKPDLKSDIWEQLKDGEAPIHVLFDSSVPISVSSPWRSG